MGRGQIHVQYDNNSAHLNVKTKGFGGNILEVCNNYPQYCQALECVMSKLNSNINGFFVSEVVNTFCEQYEVDLIIQLGGTAHHGSTSTLSSIIKSRTVTIKLNPDHLFDPSKFCVRDSIKYLYAAEAVLHESVHAILVRLTAEAGSRDKVTFLKYGERYLHYKSQLEEHESHLALWYADHSILLDYYFNKIVSDLRSFNDNYLSKDHYKYMVAAFGYIPPGNNYTWYKITGKSETDLYWNYHVKLKNKTTFPCCTN